MERIAIVGSGGAGKSTFARRLGRAIGLEVVHLDTLMWRPNWELVSREEQKQIQLELLASPDGWIIDGNYGFTMELRLQAADTIIFLDLPRWLCMTRIVKRRIHYHNRSRPDMREGNKEQLTLEFLRFVWGFKKNKRPQIKGRLQKLENEKRVVILHSRREVEAFLRGVEGA
ncbi:DNA topology modulation protein [Paenalkalicoccus suaedae]|uniref:DNA topology modulation protein n=1 Tax=Paenalkalicoccus suaedae TaxID=2592382 RepID=A0A859FI53_9BACI|nr:DNA topology modulation protein [Paenalkalicoccus suaedae]QKS72528.1 DNA topology modulation protein [Paenalkalicoccus suaedae]